jgi:hypothetical protein
MFEPPVYLLAPSAARRLIVVREASSCQHNRGGQKPRAGTERKAILGGKRRPVRVKDRDSGTLYDSKLKEGKVPAAEFGLDPNEALYRIGS